jgi:hypothetical protein
LSVTVETEAEMGSEQFVQETASFSIPIAIFDMVLEVLNFL